MGAGAPDADVLEASSGAAFAAVVLGQAANAFACRSASSPAWRLGLFSNPFLLAAVGLQCMLLAAMLWIGPVAHLLGQAPPPWQGALVAFGAIPAVLAADGLHKAVRRRIRHARAAV